MSGMNFACVRKCTDNAACTIEEGNQSTDIACSPGDCEEIDGVAHYCDNAVSEDDAGFHKRVTGDGFCNSCSDVVCSERYYLRNVFV